MGNNRTFKGARYTRAVCGLHSLSPDSHTEIPHSNPGRAHAFFHFICTVVGIMVINGTLCNQFDELLQNSYLNVKIVLLLLHLLNSSFTYNAYDIQKYLFYVMVYTWEKPFFLYMNTSLGT